MFFGKLPDFIRNSLTKESPVTPSINAIGISLFANFVAFVSAANAVTCEANNIHLLNYILYAFISKLLCTTTFSFVISTFVPVFSAFLASWYAS